MSTIIKKATKKLTGKYRPMIRSRHPSHNELRTCMERLPFRSVIRMGSMTELTDPATLAGTRIELNSKEAIRNSSSKLRMKTAFDTLNVKTATWIKAAALYDLEEKDYPFDFPMVGKHIFGSRGTGNKLIKSKAELDIWFKDKTFENFIVEKFCNYNKEYRLHITKDGCFYTCRKMLREMFKDHPNAWQRHDDNCVWVLEENENFDKPNNWDEIVRHCVNALKACGLDFGACDLRVQNNTDSDGKRRENCDFIVVEINSAPSFGKITLDKYKDQLYKLLIDKYNDRSN